jgi:hypothetical protein
VDKNKKKIINCKDLKKIDNGNQLHKWRKLALSSHPDSKDMQGQSCQSSVN